MIPRRSRARLLAPITSRGVAGWILTSSSREYAAWVDSDLSEPLQARGELETHLSLLKREGLVEGWHDRRIAADTEWAGAIDDLAKADVVVARELARRCHGQPPPSRRPASRASLVSS